MKQQNIPMLCDICGKQAAIHLTEVVNGDAIEKHLCPQCASIVEKIPIRNRERDAQMAEFMKHVEARTHPSWEGRAGEHLQTMLNSREECVKRLSSPFPQIRNVSWQMLLKRWKTDVDLVPRCRDTIRHDPDVEVRVRAMYYLAALYRQSTDPRDSAFFAEVALASDTPIRMREAAYFGLLRMHGLPIPRELRLNIQRSAPERSYPIDWEFVRRFEPPR